jgi:hypothetical protein
MSGGGERETVASSNGAGIIRRGDGGSVVVPTGRYNVVDGTPAVLDNNTPNSTTRRA